MEEFSSFQGQVQSALVSTTRAAAALATEDIPFHRSLSARLASRLDGQNARLLDLASRLLGAATSASASVGAAPSSSLSSLKDLDGVEGDWRAVVDVVDSLLERADTALDEFTGAVKRLTPDAETQSAAAAAAKAPRTSKIAQQLKAQDMEKPQLTFDHVPTNTEAVPFRPLLQSKPHALVPLESEPLALNQTSQLQHSHPYQLEIERYEYPTAVYTRSDPTPYLPFDSTSATFVDTESGVEEMLQELREAKEIAIDLEHHDQRSYAGIVCLMQISTRNRDWIVDTLKPWRRKLQCLNEVFTDPQIVKVLHGAYMDIVWLQRDLGLYVVGLFDTHYASRALGYAGGSLAFLLKKFANVDANKQYQMADWRIRPLPQELIDYARSDTHYLLYIYDCMRNELIQRSNPMLPDRQGDKLFDVLRKSRETALQRYEYPVYDPDFGQGPVGWYKILLKTPANFSKEQFAVFRAVHRWRDEVAREQDDSVHYVMPNHQLFSITREIPTSRAALLGLAQPTTQTVRLRAEELVSVIVDAKERGKDGPTMLDVLKRFEPQDTRGVGIKAERSIPVASAVPKPSPLTNGNGGASSQLRSATSAFWGGALDHDSRGYQRRTLSSVPTVSLSVPLPALAEQMLIETDETVSPVQAPDHAVNDVLSSPLPDQESENDQLIVLRGSNKKRKRDQPENTALAVVRDGIMAQSDKVTFHTEEAQAEAGLLSEKSKERKAKKEAKRAAKLAAASTNDDEEEPFDYASAPSVLHHVNADHGAGRHAKKQANPYAKSLDAPKGLPRNPAGKEKAGRSMTYR